MSSVVLRKDPIWRSSCLCALSQSAEASEILFSVFCFPFHERKQNTVVRIQKWRSGLSLLSLRGFSHRAIDQECRQMLSSVVELSIRLFQPMRIMAFQRRFNF
jgi:hypothetical protein